MNHLIVMKNKTAVRCDDVILKTLHLKFNCDDEIYFELNESQCCKYTHGSTF